MSTGTKKLSQILGIRQRTSALYLCLLAAVVAPFGFSGCAGVTQQTPQTSPQISVIPDSIVFSNVLVGQKSSQTVQISNTGQGNLSVTGISLAGTGFSLSSTAVPFQLAAGESKHFTVTFAASSATSTKGTLTISSSAGAPVSVAVVGGGQAPSPSWQVSPTSLTFPSIALQSTETQNASIKNSGNVSLTIGSVNTTGAAFSTSGLSTGMTLSPGQQVNFQVSFHPTTVGNLTGSLAVSSPAVSSVLRVNLAGSGLNAAAPVQHTVTLRWSPSTSSVAGYHIYRGTVSGGPYSLLNPTPDTATSYTDASVVSGKQYFYVATAVDSKGEESGYSNEASATIPNP